MKAAALRWCTVVVFLLLVLGCGGDGGDDDENPNALTVTNLQGTYDLNTNAMPGDLAGDDGLNAIAGMVAIAADTLTLTATLAGMGSFTLVGTTLTITDSDGETNDLQVTLSETGNTLTILDDDGETTVLTRRGGNGTSNAVTVANLQGTYDVDVARSTDEDLVSGELDVAGSLVTISVIAAPTGSFTLAGKTLTFTQTDGDIDVFQATLTNDGNILTLVTEDDDTLVFARR